MKSLFRKQRGDVATILTLIALGLMTAGIGVGTYLSQKETRTIPKAEGCIYQEVEPGYIPAHRWCSESTDPFAVCERGVNYACYAVNEGDGWRWRWRERKTDCRQAVSGCALYKFKEGGWGSGCCDPETGEWLAGSDCKGKICAGGNGACGGDGRCIVAETFPEVPSGFTTHRPIHPLTSPLWWKKERQLRYEFDAKICSSDERARYQADSFTIREVSNTPYYSSRRPEWVDNTYIQNVYLNPTSWGGKYGECTYLHVVINMHPSWLEAQKAALLVIKLHSTKYFLSGGDKGILLGEAEAGAPTPTPTSAPGPTTPTPTSAPPECHFKATVSAKERTTGKVIDDWFGFYNNKGQGYESFGGRTFETDSLVPWEKDAFITIKYKGESLSTTTMPWRIVGTFCTAGGTGRCPSTTGQAVNPFGGESDGFKVGCGAEYDYGWYLEQVGPTPTPTPPTPEKLPGEVRQIDWFKKGETSPRCWFGKVTDDKDSCYKNDNFNLGGGDLSCEKGSDWLRITNNSDNTVTLHCDWYKCDFCATAPHDPNTVQCDNNVSPGSFQGMEWVDLAPGERAKCFLTGGVQKEGAVKPPSPTPTPTQPSRPPTPGGATATPTPTQTPTIQCLQEGGRCDISCDLGEVPDGIKGCPRPEICCKPITSPTPTPDSGTCTAAPVETGATCIVVTDNCNPGFICNPDIDDDVSNGCQPRCIRKGLGIPVSEITPKMVDQVAFPDGFVNAKDYDTVIANYGVEGAARGDINKDAIPNGLDLSLVILNIGKEAR